MTTTLQLVLANPMPGMEDAFNHWYGGEHFRHGVLTPGVDAGQRFRRVPAVWPAGKHDYLMIWEIGDPAFTLAELAKVKGTDTMPISPALDYSTVQPPTMWRRAIVYTAARVATLSPARGTIIVCLYKAAAGQDSLLVETMTAGRLAKLADQPGVFSAEYLTLADEQIRGNCRKYPHGVLIEVHDEAAAVAALHDELGTLPYTNHEDWMAVVFRPIGERMTKREAEALGTHAVEV